MAADTLIRVIQAGFVREYKLKAVLGEFWERVEKAHGIVEIQDTELESKLEDSELKQLYAKFPYLNPNRPLPPKPVDEVVEFRKELIDEVDATPVQWVNEDEEAELRAKLDEAGVKHGNIKKIEKLREKVTQL